MKAKADRSRDVVVVTGSSGFIGSAVVAKLAERFRVVGGEIQHELGCLIHGEAWQTLEIPKSVARTGAWVETEVLDQDPFIKPWMVDISDDHYELDTGRARKLLGWKPRHSLR